MTFAARALFLAGIVSGMAAGAAEALTIVNRLPLTMQISLYDSNDGVRSVTCFDFTVGPNSTRIVSTGEMRIDIVRDCGRFDRLYLKAEPNPTVSYMGRSVNCFAPSVAKEQSVEIWLDGNITRCQVN